MPKKSSRSKAKHRDRSTKAIPVKHPRQVKTAAAEPKPATEIAAVETGSVIKTVSAKLKSVAKPAPGTQDYVSRYRYVMPEVKRIGILAGSIIVVLIILSFIL
jgi:hypothetical protein